MKTRIFKILCVLLLVASSLMTMAAAPARHQPQITHFSGTEKFVGADPNAGTIREVGGKTYARGLVAFFADSVSDPRVNGDVRAVINYNYDGPPFTGTGPVWGTETLTNAGGSWSIYFVGYQSANAQTSIHLWGIGEGRYKGLTAVWEITSKDNGLTGTVSGAIFEHD